MVLLVALHPSISSKIQFQVVQEASPIRLQHEYRATTATCFLPPGHTGDRVLTALAMTLINTLLYRYYMPSVGPNRADRVTWRSETKLEKTHHWPANGYSMAGDVGMWNLFDIYSRVRHAGTAGDFVETGVWKGASGIYMRMLFDAVCDNSRHIYSLDSYEWLPPPDSNFQADRGDRHSTYLKAAPSLKAGVDDVREYHLRFGINTTDPSRKVTLVKGWFENTAPALAQTIGPIAILRLDGDMYKSTWVVLQALYHKVAIGGYVIIDDYKLPGCRKAVHDFLQCIQFDGQLHWIGKAYWQKSTEQLCSRSTPPR